MLTPDPTLFAFTFRGESFPVTPWTLVAVLLGQGLFTARTLLQWGLSEKHRRCVTPTSYWWLSLVATVVMIAYSFQRGAAPFVLGFAVNLVPYTRNLMLSYRLTKGARPLAMGSCLAVLAVLVVLASQQKMTTKGGWFFVGLAGFMVFYSRFLIQWYHSERLGKSEFSLAFWYTSLVGALILLVYGFSLRDVGFIVAYLFNSIPYTRNIMIIYRERAASETEQVKGPP